MVFDPNIHPRIKLGLLGGLAFNPLSMKVLDEHDVVVDLVRLPVEGPLTIG